mgnify:FL=1
MTDPDYNLLDEAWIPVRLLDGSVEKMGLLDVFRNTNEIADLACELPTQKIAIQRILLAVCYRVTSLKSVKEWKRQWAAGAPTEEAIAYLERWRDRFFLFGGDYPFMQAPGLCTRSGDIKMLDVLIADVPNNKRLFSMRHGKAIESIPPSEAAMWIVHAHAFDVSGIHSAAVDDSHSSGPRGFGIGPSWCGQNLIVLLKGDNLDETLVLNLVPRNHGGLKSRSSDDPGQGCTWEDASIETGDRIVLGKQQLNVDDISVPRLLTWHSRRVRLFGGRSGVTGAICCQGDELKGRNMFHYEPMGAWRYNLDTSKKFRTPVYTPVPVNIGRAFWRDVPAVLHSVAEVEGVKGMKQRVYRSPAVVDFYYEADFESLPDFPPRVRMEAFGMKYGSNQSVYGDSYNDELPLSSALLKKGSDALGSLVESQVHCAEELANALGRFAANLARAAGQSGEGAGDGARSRAREQFFALVDDPFRRWLARLGGDSDVDAVRGEWHEELRRIVRLLVKRLVDEAPASATIGRETKGGFMSVGIAENILWAAVNKTIPRTEDQVKEGEK